MEPVLGGRANVNPPLILNQNSFPGDSDSTSTPRELQKDEASNDVPVDDSGDPFLTGVTHRAKKKCRTRDPNEGIKTMLEVFEKKWEDEKMVDTLARDEEKKGREQILDIMKKNQETMSDAVDVLRFMAQKM